VEAAPISGMNSLLVVIYSARDTSRIKSPFAFPIEDPVKVFIVQTSKKEIRAKTLPFLLLSQIPRVR
jgi:hypothetical protein